jgi:hypothetical protein
MVGGVFMAVAALLEGLQALTPDRSAYLPAVFYGAGGALAATLIAELFIQARRWHVNNTESDKWMSHAAFPRPHCPYPIPRIGNLHIIDPRKVSERGFTECRARG